MVFTGSGRPTVLVVEDESELADLYEHWLRDDYECIVTYDGDDGLAAMNEEVDVVVLDRRMPSLSGDEVLEALKDEGYGASVVMVTAVDPDLDLATLPIDDYVEKPVTRDVFLDTVSRMATLQDAAPATRRYHSLERRRDILRTSRAVSEFTESEEYETLAAELDAAAAEAGDELDWLDKYVYGSNEH